MTNRALLLFALLATGPLTEAATRPFSAAELQFETLKLGASVAQFERRYAATLCDRDRLSNGTRMVWFHAAKPCRQAEPLPEQTIFALFTDADGALEGFVWFGDWLKAAKAFPVPVGATVKVAEATLGRATPAGLQSFDDRDEKIELWRHRGGITSITASGKIIGFIAGVVPDRDAQLTVTNARRYLSAANADAEFVRSADTLCRIQTEVNGDASLKTEGARMLAVVERITADKLSPAFRSFMMSIAGVRRGSRYALIEAEVREHGNPAWSCPGMALEDSAAP